MSLWLWCCVVPGVVKDCSAFVFRVKLGTEDDGTVVLRNVSNYLPHGTVSRPKRLESSTCLLPAYQHATWKTQNDFLLNLSFYGNLLTYISDKSCIEIKHTFLFPVTFSANPAV